MPDQLNKQSLINLLIDSPLREPIKINLIDIANNTTDPDLPKIFPTIVKELEIFQKATERRMKLADETIAKLGGTSTEPSDSPAPMSDVPPTPPTANSEPAPVTPAVDSTVPAADPGLSVPPLDLPPLPTAPATETPAPMSDVPPAPAAPMPDLAASAPATATETASPAPLPTPEPLGGSAPTSQGDEAALAEIQKELDSLKNATADEITAAAVPTPVAPPVQQ